MTFERQKIDTIYSIFEKSHIHEYYHKFLQVLYKTEYNTHPSEILINYDFVSKQKYIEVMNEKFYNDKMREINIDEVVNDENLKIFDLKYLSLPEVTKEAIETSLKNLSNTLTLIPLAIANEDTLLWIYKEPETIKNKEADSYRSVKYNTDNIKHDLMISYANKITSQCRFTHSVVWMVTNNDYIDIVKHLNKHYVRDYKYLDFNFNIRYFVRKKLIEGVSKGASDIYFWGTRIGSICNLEYSYTILNDNVKGKTLECTKTQLNEVNAEIWSWAAQAEEMRNDQGMRNFSIENVLMDPADNIRFTGRLNLLGDVTSSDKVCIRITPTNKAIIPFEKFNVTPIIKDKIIKQTTLNDSGIILFSGSTGSGKSTLLRSILAKLQELRPYHRIDSVEAPIEAVIPGVCQINIDDSSPLTASDITVALTRRNPKIINLNEINTNELLKFCIDSSLMQLLILTTIHTANVQSIPDRVQGLLTGDTQFLYSQFIDNISMMMHLTMLKEACPYCCEEVDRSEDIRITNDEIELMNWFDHTSNTIYMPAKNLNERKDICPHCENRGFLIDKPIVCVEYIEVDGLMKSILKNTPPYLMSTTIKNIMMKEGTTGTHDALKYMRDRKVTWDMIYKRFSLYNQRYDYLNKETEGFDKYVLVKKGGN